MDECGLFFTGHPALKSEGAVEKILSNTANCSNGSVCCKRFLSILLSIILLVVYSITSYKLGEDGHKFVAGINSIYILAADIMY